MPPAPIDDDYVQRLIDLGLRLPLATHGSRGAFAAQEEDRKENDLKKRSKSLYKFVFLSCGILYHFTGEDG